MQTNHYAVQAMHVSSLIGQTNKALRLRVWAVVGYISLRNYVTHHSQALPPPSSSLHVILLQQHSVMRRS